MATKLELIPAATTSVRFNAFKSVYDRFTMTLFVMMGLRTALSESVQDDMFWRLDKNPQPAWQEGYSRFGQLVTQLEYDNVLEQALEQLCTDELTPKKVEHADKQPEIASFAA